MATSRSRLHVAVVMTVDPDLLGYGVELSGRPMRDWACFVGGDRDAVVEMALGARDKWTRNEDVFGGLGGDGRYQILVGTLDSAVEVPANYELVPLKAGA